jgi:sporulation protein YlmC with PRC-barrel domain
VASEKENIKDTSPAVENIESKIENADSLLSDFDATCGEGMPSPEKLAEMARKAPDPAVTGNAQVEVVSHGLLPKTGKDEGAGKGVIVSLKNVTDTSIGKAVLEAVLFDVKGDIVDTLKHTIVDFEAGKVRTVRMETRLAETVDVKSYDVKITDVVVTPVPVATGDDRVSILRHNFQNIVSTETSQFKHGIELIIKNVTQETITAAVFKAEVYDSEGNCLGTVRHIESDIKPGTSRAMTIQISKIKDSSSASSYRVSILKTVTAEVEKVLLRKHERRTMVNGDENITGILKNVHGVKTDAVVVTTFLDARDENLGVKALRVADIEPGTVKTFGFVFSPPAGEKVKTCTVDVGEMAEMLE